MRHFFTNKVRIILVLAILIAVGFTVFSALTGVDIPDLFVKSVLTPIRSGASQLTDQATQIYDYIFRYDSIVAENTALKEQIAKMQDDARLADALARENARLRALLELKESNEDYVPVDGYIISRSSNDWSNTLTIDRGTNIGIDVGMCAITANGEVVGLVTEVGVNYAVIKTVLDSTLEVSATIASSGYNGMVRGFYAEGEESMLRMDYLPSDAVIRNKDQVVTSGSTVYPRDLVIGHVVDAGFSDTGVAKFAVLQPAADIDTLEQVFIITSYNVG